MLDGLYKVEFHTPLGAGSGVVHALGGRMWGGDAGIAYVGSYRVSDTKMTATVSTSRHTQTGYGNVFGKDSVTISLEGTVNGNTITCAGTSPQAPGVNFTAKLTKISD